MTSEAADTGEWSGDTLPDFLAPDLTMLLVGLNPSIYSVSLGVPFARPGNRFWPAAIQAGIVSVDRDPEHALRAHRVGFTDLVKRPTVRADELSVQEYCDGAARLTAIVKQYQPLITVFVGLSGYRAAVDRNAKVGLQSLVFGGRNAYVMPNPSGLNAHTNVTDLAQHFQSVARLASKVASTSR